MNRMTDLLADPTHIVLRLDWPLLRDRLRMLPGPRSKDESMPPASARFLQAEWLHGSPLVTLTLDTGDVRRINTSVLVELAARVARARELAPIAGRAVAYAVSSIRVMDRELVIRAQSTEAPFIIADRQSLRVDVICPACGSRVLAKIHHMPRCRCTLPLAVFEA